MPLVALAWVMGRGGAITAVAIPFALAHLLNPNLTALGVGNIALAGIFLGVMFYAPGGIWTATGAHLGWNGILACLDTPVSGLPFDLPLLDYRSGGPAWLTGDYVTVVELSPDERFLYYLPGAHGGAVKTGTPVIQYEIATGRRKVLAFLAAAFEKEYDYVPAGTYGMKVGADGGTLYVNFNGHAGDRVRPATTKPNGFK